METAVVWMLWIALAALAVNQAVETIHHGSLFAGLRRWARKSAESPASSPDERLLGELIGCPFCLAHWVSAAIVVLLAFGLLVGRLFLLPIVWLAVVCLARLWNDVSYPYNRMHGSDDDAESTRSDTDGDEVFHEEVSIVLPAHEERKVDGPNGN